MRRSSRTTYRVTADGVRRTVRSPKREQLQWTCRRRRDEHGRRNGTRKRTYRPATRRVTLLARTCCWRLTAWERMGRGPKAGNRLIGGKHREVLLRAADGTAAARESTRRDATAETAGTAPRHSHSRVWKLDDVGSAAVERCVGDGTPHQHELIGRDHLT